MNYSNAKPAKMSVLLSLALFALFLSGCQKPAPAAPSLFPKFHGNIRQKTSLPMKEMNLSLTILYTAVSAIPIQKHGRNGPEPLNICIIRRNASCVSPGPAPPKKNRSFSTCTISLRNRSIHRQEERTRHPIPVMCGTGMKEILS